MKFIINNKAERVTQQMAIDMFNIASKENKQFTDITDGINKYVVVMRINKQSTCYTIYNA